MTEKEIDTKQFEQFTARIPSPGETGLADTVSQWTQGQNMLPKSPEDIMTMIADGRLMIAENATGELVSCMGFVEPYPDGSVEVGTLVTSEEHRGKGAGTFITKQTISYVRSLFPDQTIFGLTNQNSKPLFLKLGGTEMRTSQLCDAVWEACEDCPNKPETTGEVFMCCDTPIEVTHIGK